MYLLVVRLVSTLVAFLVLGLIFAGSASAQAVVEGRVTANGEPFPGANVRVEATTRGSSAGPDGRYRIDALEPGVRTIVASAVGLKTVRRSVRLADGDTARVDFSLEETVIRGEEVVVTGTMRETYVKDSPVKVSVMRPDRMGRGRASSNLMDVIGSVSGLSTQLNCGVCGTNAIRINGVEGPNTAVLIDGMPMMGALASVYGLNGISPMIIDRVEVIRGPQSTLYGTQALGGVVNIITKNPASTPTVSTNLYAGNTGETSLDVSASPELGRWDGFVSGNVHRMENFVDRNGDGFADEPMRTRGALFAKGVLTGENSRPIATVAAKGYAEDRTGGVPGFTDAMRGSNEVYGESIYTRRGELLFELRPPRFDRRLRISGALTVHDQDSYYGTEHYDARQRIAYTQATYDRALGEDARLLGGVSLRHVLYEDNTPATSAGPSRRFIPGLFAESEVTLGPWTLLGGMRVDHHQEHGVIPAPRLAAKWDLSDRTTFRLNGGTGFRVVNVFTEDHAALTGSREVVFEEALDPERSYSLTGSLQQIIPFGTNPLTLELDGFYTRFSNKIIPDYDRDPDLIVYDNLDGRSVTRGASVDLSQNFTAFPLTYNAGLTLMDVYSVEGGRRTPVTYAPDYLGTLGVTYTVRNADLRFDYEMRLVGPKRMPESYGAFDRPLESPAFTTHDLKVAHELASVHGPRGAGIELYLSGKNIFDFTQPTPLVAASEPFGDEFDTVYTWGPVLGRTISLGIRLTVR